MVCNLVWYYITDNPEHIITICEKMTEMDRSPGVIYRTPRTLDNPLYPIMVTLYPSNRVVLTGSIHKFQNKPKHCNDTDLFISEALNSITEVCTILNIDLKLIDPKISKIEIGLNLNLLSPVLTFLEALNTYKSYSFNYSKPRSGETKKWGKEIRTTDYDVKFYNKSYLANKELKYNKYLKENLLRMEITYNRHVKRYLGFDTIKGLIENASIVSENIINTLNNVSFKTNIDFKLLTIEELFIAEAFNSEDFYNKIKYLPRSYKRKIAKMFKELLYKFPETNQFSRKLEFMKRKAVKLNDIFPTL